MAVFPQQEMPHLFCGMHLPLVFFIWYSDSTFSITYVLFGILGDLNVVQDLMMLNIIEAMVYPKPPSHALPQQAHPISSISEIPPLYSTALPQPPTAHHTQ
ncbi:hypothetical protein EDD16DRAFT_1523365 [Pisolithus croceorrhizus]|nr:hypothetical protein EV401DRAFT_1892499 [Pisolithus croceorrhizus]KAI6107192.1 hypothetical protein EDD16DRAFT_1523365 [Pisolithus croceorrhizus]KAI6143155.1 hypothetical protein EDD17DRAFT_1515619 [Pisolithus thermaeus]